MDRPQNNRQARFDGRPAPPNQAGGRPLRRAGHDFTAAGRFSSKLLLSLNIQRIPVGRPQEPRRRTPSGLAACAIPQERKTALSQESGGGPATRHVMICVRTIAHRRAQRKTRGSFEPRVSQTITAIRRVRRPSDTGRGDPGWSRRCGRRGRNADRRGPPTRPCRYPA